MTKESAKDLIMQGYRLLNVQNELQNRGEYFYTNNEHDIESNFLYAESATIKFNKLPDEWYIWNYKGIKNYE